MRTTILRLLIAVTIISTVLASCAPVHRGPRRNKTIKVDGKRNPKSNNGRGNRRP